VTAVERTVQVSLAPLALAVWEAGARAGWIDRRLAGTPSAILGRTARDLAGGVILPHLAVTFGEMMLGFAAGLVTGVAAGLLLARLPTVRAAVMPYLTAVYAIPRPALAPLFVLWFGVGFVSKLILVVTLVYFVYLLHVLAGLQALERRHVDWLRTLGASPRQVLRHVGLPHLAPWLFAATKLGLALALVGAIVGEFISARAGLGFLMMQAAEIGDTVGVLSGVLVLSVVVVGIVVALAALEGRLFRWRVEARL
jgi:NitT/TauT family transport system permease protein